MKKKRKKGRGKGGNHQVIIVVRGIGINLLNKRNTRLSRIGKMENELKRKKVVVTLGKSRKKRNGRKG